MRKSRARHNVVRVARVRQGILFSLTCLLLFLGPQKLEAFKLGDLEILPSLESHVIYDDNVLATPSGTLERQIGDWNFRLRPGISLLYDLSPTFFELRYHTEFIFYTQPETIELRNSIGQNHSLTITGTHNFNPRFSLELSDTLRIGTNIAELAEAGVTDVGDVTVLPDSRDYTRNRANLGATVALSRQWDLIGNVEYRYNRYEGVPSVIPPLETTTEDHLGTALGVAAFKWHPRNTLNATLGFSYFDYDLRGLSRIYFATLGDSWQVTDAMLLTAAAGIQYLVNQTLLGTATNTASRGSVHPFGEVEASYEIQKFTFFLLGTYSLQDSSGEGGTVLSASVRGSILYEPIPDLALRAFGFYARDESVPDAGILDFLQIDSIQAGGTVNYSIWRWFSVNFQYYFIDQDTTRATGPTHYIDNRFLLGCIISDPT